MPVRELREDEQVIRPTVRPLRDDEEVVPRSVEPAPSMGAETSPLEPPKEIPPPPTGPGSGPGGPDPAGRPVDEIIFKAAMSGVEWQNPAPAGHFLASLAGGREDRIEAYRLSLKKALGKDVEVRIGEGTGAIEYLNPETNRWSLVNPPGFSTEDIEGLGGLGIVLGAETGGGILGGISTAGPGGAILGGAGGAALGELSRLVLGKKLGINKNMTPEDIAQAAAIEGGIALAGGVITDKVLTFLTYVSRRLLGAPVQQSLIDNLGLSEVELNRAADLVDAINEKIDGRRFQFNLAQASQDENLLITQQYLRDSPHYSKEFGQIEAEQEAALKEFWDAIHSPYRSRATTPEAGRRAIDVAGEQTAREIRRADIPVEMKRAELETAINSSSSQPFETLGRQLREFGDAEQEAFNEWGKRGAEALHKLAGGKEFIENRNLHNVVTHLDDRVSDALFPSVEKPTKGLLGPEVLGKDEAGNDIVNKIFDPNAKFTFRQAWNAISALKRVERVAAKGLSTETPEAAAVKQLRRALEKDMKQSAQGTSLSAEYDQFILRYAQEKRRLDKGTVGQMMVRSEGDFGRWKIADENVFRSFITKGTDREAKELFDLVKDSPEMMQAVRESMVDFYKREVLENGRINMTKHNRFMKDYLRAAGVFFKKSELEIFSRPGQIEKALQAREKARSIAIDRINKSFTAEVANLNNPGKLLNLIKDTKNPDKARELVAILQDTPDALRGVRNEFRKFMMESVSGQFRPPAGRTFSAARLDTFLTGKGGEGGHLAIARNLFGEQYANDLQLLNDVLRRVRAEPRTVNTSKTAFWEDTVKGLARAYVGLFTTPGRFITAAVRIKKRFAENVLYRTIGDPANLRKLMALRGVDMRNRKARAVLGELGATFLVHDAPDSAD